jgi:hypothetical protein
MTPKAILLFWNITRVGFRISDDLYSGMLRLGSRQEQEVLRKDYAPCVNYYEHSRFYYTVCNLTINTRVAKDFPFLIRIIR